MDLKRVLEPESIAVFGVSRSNPFHPANVIYNKNHLKYLARTYCINPKGGTLYRERIHRSIHEVPERVDLAVLAIRSDYVPETIEECIDAGVNGAIVISGGFAETGRHDLQERLVAISREHGFPVIGPNCLGIFSPPSMDTFFLSPERLVETESGTVSLISQSGGILVDLLIKLTQEDVGVSKAVSIGNKATIDEVDLLEFFGRDPSTDSIGIYIEGFKPDRGRDFMEMMQGFSKPVIFLKSGKTPGGSRAVSSHTASLAGDYRVFSEVIKQSGAIEARNETEFVSYCEALSCCRSRNVRNVCIVTGSGGHGAMAADLCYMRGLHLVDVPEKDRTDLGRDLSASVQPIASLGNPIDLTGSAIDDDFLAATKCFLEKDYVDCIVLLLLPYLPGITSDIGGRISQIAREYNKPIITYIPHVAKYTIFIEGFELNGLPVSHSVEGAVYMAESLLRT